METLLMVFMAFAAIVCVFAVVVVLRDVIRDIADSRKEKKAVEAPCAACPQEESAAPAEPAVVEPAVAEPAPAEELVESVAVAEPAAESEEGKISFEANTKDTLEEKYMRLSSECKAYYDEIVKYAANAEGAKRVKNTRYEEYKVGNSRIVRVLIKRDVIQCEFTLVNSEFRNYVNENKISVKQSATIIKVTDEEAVTAVKNSIDIAVKAIAEEKEYKRQLAREKRRAKRQNAENGQTT